MSQNTKKCSTCKERLPFEQFCKNARLKDGLNNRCRKCSADYDKAYQEKNKERRKLYKKNYNIENAEKIREYNQGRKHITDAWRAENAEYLTEYRKKWWPEYAARQKALREVDLTARFDYLMKTRRSNAREKSLEFTIDIHFLAALYMKQNGRCALTDLPFDMKFSEDYRSAAFGPSIDRIDSRKGYTPDNVQIVCFIVNMAKSEYDQTAFDQMCRARVEQLNRG